MDRSCNDDDDDDDDDVVVVVAYEAVNVDVNAADGHGVGDQWDG